MFLPRKRRASGRAHIVGLGSRQQEHEHNNKDVLALFPLAQRTISGHEKGAGHRDRPASDLRGGIRGENGECDRLAGEIVPHLRGNRGRGSGEHARGKTWKFLVADRQHPRERCQKLSRTQRCIEVGRPAPSGYGPRMRYIEAPHTLLTRLFTAWRPQKPSSPRPVER